MIFICNLGITGKRELKLGAAIHRSVIEVNESGIDTPPETLEGRTFGCCELPDDFVIFKCEHPFMFLVRMVPFAGGDSIILFVGRFKTPRPEIPDEKQSKSCSFL